LPAVLDRKVQNEVLEAIPEAKRGIFLCLSDLLVRPSEARVLRLRDWSGEEIRIERGAKDRLVGGMVRGVKRSGGEKTLPVSRRLAGWLESHVLPRRRVNDPDGSLFWNPDAQEGAWWSETAPRRTWGTACSKVGVRVSLYEGTKHSTATHLKGLGADDRLLASIMGHTDIRSVEKYARVQGRTIKNALAKLDPDA
jgi:integrase